MISPKPGEIQGPHAHTRTTPESCPEADALKAHLASLYVLGLELNQLAHFALEHATAITHSSGAHLRPVIRAARGAAEELIDRTQTLLTELGASVSAPRVRITSRIWTDGRGNPIGYDTRRELFERCETHGALNCRICAIHEATPDAVVYRYHPTACTHGTPLGYDCIRCQEGREAQP